MEVSCQIGDGRKVRFWEDQWFGNSNLAIQYWALYYISNEKNITQLTLDGMNLKQMFRGTVSP